MPHSFIAVFQKCTPQIGGGWEWTIFKKQNLVVAMK